MENYVADICNNVFLNFVYAPYQDFSLFSVTKDIDSWKQFFHPKKVNYAQKLCFQYIDYVQHAKLNICWRPLVSEVEFSYRFLLK